MSAKQKQRARGVIPGYEYLLKDVQTVREKINGWYPDVPVILFGHSMGANIAANYLIRSATSTIYAKAILEAPWLRLYKPLPKFATSIARLIGKASGNFTISANLDMDAITRNSDITKNLRDDGIFHTRMSLRLYAEIVEAGEFALEKAGEISVPTLLLCPGADKIVCPKTIREFYERCKDNVVFKEYPDAYHCLHADTINVEVMAEVLGFVIEG